MPRPSKGPRLYFRKDKGYWYIRHRHRIIGTGCAETDVASAEAVLRRYVENGATLDNPDEFDGLIYFISCHEPDGYPVKIGFTRGLVSRRMASLQMACPYELVNLGHMPGNTEDEFSLHRMFRAEHLRGEWFVRTHRLMLFIAENVQNISGTGPIKYVTKRERVESKWRKLVGGDGLEPPTPSV